MNAIRDLRRQYASRALLEREADANPLRQFERWFDEALRAEIVDVNAMTLATASASGEPSARIVLLRGADERGFDFYTNYESAKAHDLDANPRGCLLFFWAELERQIRITGAISRVPSEESEAYFHSRPFESQVSSWASAQSRPLESRAELDRRFEELLSRHRGHEVPLPPFWGGYRLSPERIEFWQGRQNRLHDRLLYTRDGGGGWSRVRLSP